MKKEMGSGIRCAAAAFAYDYYDDGGDGASAFGSD
jgi:hypothetical protein